MVGVDVAGAGMSVGGVEMQPISKNAERRKRKIVRGNLGMAMIVAALPGAPNP